MEMVKETEEVLRTSREWGYGIAGYRLKEISEIMQAIAVGYRRRGEMGPANSLFPEAAPTDGGVSRNVIWSTLLRECRDMLAKQYEGLAQMFREVSFGFADGNKQSREMRDFLKERLSEEKIRVRQVIFVPVGNDRREIHMVARITHGASRLTDEIAYLLSQVIGETFVPAEGCRRVFGREYDYYVFRQTENYRLVTGAVRASKNAGEPSGDNYSVMKPCFGEAAMLISDGMGSGLSAYRESAAVIELMEMFLQAGFREETMISLINSVLLLGTEAQTYSTLDLSLVNLFDGTACFAKSGASLTYIKHEDWAEIIENTSPPVGIIPEIHPCITRKRLFHGESVIMLSDGVTDYVSSQFIKELKDGRPQDMAGAILLEALKGNHYEPTDDMTVLVAKLERVS